jgi:hypothetical protein
MDCDRLVFSGHVITRMFERKLRREHVASIVAGGEVVQDYPDDTPYPSALILGFVETVPIHVVVGRDLDSGTCYIVTAYIPDPKRWSADFRSKRQ